MRKRFLSVTALLPEIYIVYRVSAILVLAAGLCSCGLAMQIEQQTRQAAALKELSVANDACSARFSESASDAVARAKCFNDADRIVLPVVPYPDLLNLRMAKRTELAERQAAGKI